MMMDKGAADHTSRPFAMVIRPETPQDAQAIHDLTAAAFAPMRFSNGSEPDAITQMRDAGDLVLSLVAEQDGALIAHVAFSRVLVDGADTGWYGLGPVSVKPGWQRAGIGSKIVAAGLAQLKSIGANGVALTGNPQVYNPMGFTCDGKLHHVGTPDWNVLWQVLHGTPPTGTLLFAPALEACT